MATEINLPTVPNPLAVISDNTVLVNQVNLNVSQLVVGKHYQAEVVTSLKDGSYIVKVADSLARMQLPNLPEVGTRLQLTLISTSPRATFLLNAPDAKPAVTASRSELTQTSGAKNTAVLTGSSLPAKSAALSSAGKLIDQLLQHTPKENTVTIGKAPLLVTPDVNTNTMSQALQNSVSSSGVFYESHLVQWAKGKLDVAELMKEPQASFTAQIKNSPENNAAAVPKEATSIIQQQLQTMEQQRFAWQGELWPGQPVEWEISRDAPEQQHGQSEQTWQSAVKFELPQLGSVSAQLQLTGERIKLTVHTQDASTTQKLQSHTNELVGALEGSGVKLDALLIQTKKCG